MKDKTKSRWPMVLLALFLMSATRSIDGDIINNLEFFESMEALESNDDGILQDIVEETDANIGEANIDEIKGDEHEN